MGGTGTELVRKNEKNERKKNFEAKCRILTFFWLSTRRWGSRPPSTSSLGVPGPVAVGVVGRGPRTRRWGVVRRVVGGSHGAASSLLIGDGAPSRSLVVVGAFPAPSSLVGAFPAPSSLVGVGGTSGTGGVARGWSEKKNRIKTKKNFELK